MTAIFSYLFQVIVCSSLFAGCYWLTMRNERFYHWNRFYIVTSVVLSIIIPLLNIPVWPAQNVMPDVTGYLTHIVSNPVEVATTPIQAQATSISWTWVVWIAFLSIVLLLLVKEIFSFLRILRIKNNAQRIRIPEAVLYYTDDAMAPFSFFHTIFWKKGVALDSDEGRCMFRHELAHVRLGHSWDKAFMQLVNCLFWMNPFFRLFRRELALVHEFAADGENNAEDLSSMLLCTLYPNYYYNFTNRFFQSSIKRRITMITNNKQSSTGLLRKMSIVPVILIALYLFACNSQEKTGSQETAVSQDTAVPQDTVISQMTALNQDTTAGKKEIYELDELDERPMHDGKNYDEAILEYILKTTKYPMKALEEGAQGRVKVQFIIDTNGAVTDAKISTSSENQELDAEALRVVKTIPKMTPGKKGGEAVKVVINQPITFRSKNI